MEHGKSGEVNQMAEHLIFGVQCNFELEFRWCMHGNPQIMRCGILKFKLINSTPQCIFLEIQDTLSQ